MVERREVEGAKPATLRYTTALQDGSSWKLLALIVGLVATSLFLLIVTVRISMKYVDVSRGLKNKTKDWIQLDSSHCVKTCDKEAELQKDNFNLKIELNSIKERLASCSKKDGDASITAPVVPPQSDHTNNCRQLVLGWPEASGPRGMAVAGWISRSSDSDGRILRQINPRGAAWGTMC
ncbi:uncharacterized protein O3C94_000472 isoform 2-T2 [Discoglossus pictus]